MYLTGLKRVAASLLVWVVIAAGLAGPSPAGEGTREAPKKLSRVPDPPAELRRELVALDAYRHGSEEKFAELERTADELAKKYRGKDDQARIYFAVAHVAAQSDIRRHAPRVRAYARKSLALSRDPMQRGVLYGYLGSAAEVDPAVKAFAERRRRAAEELLAGYAEMLAQELPEKPPELPVVGKFGGEVKDGERVAGLDALAQARARQEAELAARREAEFIGELVRRRDALAGQLRWLYRPHPKVYGRNPEGPDELRALAAGALKDPKAVTALLVHVMGK